MKNLADEVVVLRPWRNDDVAGMLGFADPLVQRFSWPHERAYTEADACAYLDSLARGDELGYALAEPGREDRALGGASLYDHEPAQARARIGYWLTAEGRGRGDRGTRSGCCRTGRSPTWASHSSRSRARPATWRRREWRSAAGSCARGCCAPTCASRAAGATRWSTAGWRSRPPVGRRESSSPPWSSPPRLSSPPWLPPPPERSTSSRDPAAVGAADDGSMLRMPAAGRGSRRCARSACCG